MSINTSTRFNNIPVVWRWRLIFAGSFLLFWTAYKLNIKKTIELYTSYVELEKAFAAIPKDFNVIRKDIENLASIKNVVVNDSMNMLKAISQYCDSIGIDIKEINQVYSSTNDSITIETNKIIIEGNYQKTLQLLHCIEKEKGIAAISSAEWQLTNDKATGTYSLLSIFYIKRIVHEK